MGGHTINLDIFQAEDRADVRGREIGERRRISIDKVICDAAVLMPQSMTNKEY